MTRIVIRLLKQAGTKKNRNLQFHPRVIPTTIKSIFSRHDCNLLYKKYIYIREAKEKSVMLGR